MRGDVWIWSTLRLVVVGPLFSLLLVDLFDGPELFFELHPPVLKPDLDLTFGQAKGMSDFDPSPPSQVVVEMELFFQLQSLEAGVGLTTSSARTTVGTWNKVQFETLDNNSFFGNSGWPDVAFFAKTRHVFCLKFGSSFLNFAIFA